MGAKFDEGWKVSDSKATPLKKEKLSQKEHMLVLGFEKRKGKPVTLVGRFLFDAKELKQHHKKVKQQLACGGSIEGEWLAFQGDHRDTIKERFTKLGWRFKS